ncbi:3TM-type holin [Methylobacterium sp. JK268]
MAGGIIGGAIASAVSGGISAVLPDITSTLKIVLERVIPDPAARDAAAQQIAQMMADREKAILDVVAKESEQQAAINLQEAQSPSWFVAGWRPACGWICTLGFAYSFIVAPIVTWATAIVGAALGIAFPPPPTLDNSSLLTLLGGLLGLGTLRMAEKINGVGTANLTAPLPGALSLPAPRPALTIARR